MEWLLENWFWVLIFALFIWMHLGGHGGHGCHGGHSHESDTQPSEKESQKEGSHHSH